MDNILSMPTGPWSNVKWNEVSMKEIDTLVKKGAKVNQTEILQDKFGRIMECNPLLCAIVANNIGAVVGLLKNKANPNAELLWNNDHTPKTKLMDTVNHPLMLEYMLRCGGKIGDQKIIQMCYYFLTSCCLPEKKKLNGCLQVVLAHFKQDENLKKKLKKYITDFDCTSPTKELQKKIEANKRQLMRLLIGKQENVVKRALKKVQKRTENQHN